MKRTNDLSLGDAIKMLVASYGIKSKLYESKIRDAWADMMGPTISSLTRRIDISKEGHFCVWVDSAPLRQELSYGKEKIKNLLNEKLGEEYIKTVDIR